MSKQAAEQALRQHGGELEATLRALVQEECLVR